VTRRRKGEKWGRKDVKRFTFARIREGGRARSTRTVGGILSLKAIKGGGDGAVGRCRGPGRNPIRDGEGYGGKVEEKIISSLLTSSSGERNSKGKKGEQKAFAPA